MEIRDLMSPEEQFQLIMKVRLFKKMVKHLLSMVVDVS